MKVKSVKALFPNDSIFNQKKFLDYARALPTADSLIYDSLSKVHILYTTDGYKYYVGIKKSYLIGPKYFEINFYDSGGFAKGPDWWFYKDDTFKRKRFWNQTEPVLHGNSINVKNYFEQKFYRNGQLKKEGKYKDDDRISSWNFYNKQGKLKKVKNY